MTRFIIFILALFIFTSAGKELPKILIIGDSISIGYTPFVKESLKDKALYQSLHERLQVLGKQINLFIQSVEKRHNVKG